VPYDEVNQACMRVLAEGLAGMGLLPVSVDEAGNTSLQKLSR